MSLRLFPAACVHFLNVSHSLSPSVLLPLCFAMKDTRPLEILSLRKKARVPPPPSFCFFITYYLCLTDLLQTNGCHMEKERQKGRGEGRKGGKNLFTSPFPLACEVLFLMVLKSGSVFDRSFLIFPVG